ncbi:MAG: hypothetical protein IJK97_04885, partial [Thermoguttaceae bacterium]|nr:hypothetical protein [Thermoguttaceae bacterium]
MTGTCTAVSLILPQHFQKIKGGEENFSGNSGGVRLYKTRVLWYIFKNFPFQLFFFSGEFAVFNMTAVLGATGAVGSIIRA